MLGARVEYYNCSVKIVHVTYRYIGHQHSWDDNDKEHFHCFQASTSQHFHMDTGCKCLRLQTYGYWYHDNRNDRSSTNKNIDIIFSYIIAHRRIYGIFHFIPHNWIQYILRDSDTIQYLLPALDPYSVRQLYPKRHHSNELVIHLL